METPPGEAPLLTALKKVPLKDRIFYAIVLGVLVVGLAYQPVWRVVDPDFAAVMDRIPWTDGPKRLPEIVDPWGHRFASTDGDSRFLGTAEPLVWSFGPNGRDERGGGDDVWITSWNRWAFFAADFFFTLAAILAVVWEGLRAARATMRKPRGTLPLELARASGLAVVPAVVLFGVAWWTLDLVEQQWPGVMESARASLIVPLPAALAGSAFGVSVLGFLYLRARSAED